MRKAARGRESQWKEGRKEGRSPLKILSILEFQGISSHGNIIVNGMYNNMFFMYYILLINYNIFHNESLKLRACIKSLLLCMNSYFLSFPFKAAKSMKTSGLS